MSLVLHDWKTNKNGCKARIAAEYSGVNLELVKKFEMGMSNKTANFLKLTPYWEGSFVRNTCWSCFREQCHCTLCLKDEEAAISSLKRALTALNIHLASNTYLVGHSITLADIIMTCNLKPGFSRLLTKSFTSEFPHVERYFWTLVNLPNFRKILGEVKQAESIPAVQLVMKPSQPKESAETKVKVQTNKEAKKEPTEPKVEESAQEEEAPKTKAKNPLDLLPPSKMILDEWKRLYSNTKTNFREVAVKVRMDLARKYAFGKMLVIGSGRPFKVKGLWLFRGQEILQFIMDECYDMELYDWRKVDITDEDQKERVNQMIEDHEPFEGEPLSDAKCFK
ncbi:hypothetical protein ABKV19_014108 [Rosa sericea]